MSKCQSCGAPDAQTVLLKVQWYGRGTKWLCVDCLREGLRRQELPRREPSPAGGARSRDTAR